ncbi:MAG TPA: class I SAM-dependent methyltransferase [Thermoleophilaceae bacterium]|jgi:SAM-dependent methyltransferase
MGAPETCKICAGPLALRYPGTAADVTATLLSPTNHRPGEYGDLYRCERCGTLHQPRLPPGSELAELYRQMRDDAYLAEEAGRRRTARRVLDLIARHAPSGRLLDVGCGHGLLLDEARRRGYATEGIEVSESAVAHARGALGLTIHEQPFADADLEPESYDVIVLADVLEHFDDPRAALRRCGRLLRPGGLLCVVTPDPASRTARLAGARWWALLPAHTFLIPWRTLRELLAGEQLVAIDDAPLVRSFTAGYWLAGLAERGGRLAAPVETLRRLLPRRLHLSLSLGDERVLLARRAASPRAHAPAAPREGSPEPAASA